MTEQPPRPRGRPRKDPDKLATWTPPADWVRVVAWVSPDERRALKRVAVEGDTSVAELIRALAAGLEKGVVTSEELLGHVRKGASVMDKIPTIFERGDDFRVVNRPRPGCEWVFAGEGLPTEKLDGTNIRLTIRSGLCVRVEKRRNPDKAQKARGIVDAWYVDADESSPGDRWIFDAVKSTSVTDWPDGEHSAEALGEHIQGNPLGLSGHLCVPFNLRIPAFDASTVGRSYATLQSFLGEADSLFSPGHPPEGIVFHHPDGRRAKIKRKDFPKR